MSQPPGNTWMWPQPPGIDFFSSETAKLEHTLPSRSGRYGAGRPKNPDGIIGKWNPSRWSRQGDQTAKEPAGACLIPFVCFANCEVGLGLLIFFFFSLKRRKKKKRKERRKKKRKQPNISVGGSNAAVFCVVFPFSCCLCYFGNVTDLFANQC